eukprot:CAMPEP_0181305980 /NCGR_PEP_ID=MMETSP1101-20121128/10040_1 /TAXON_ID=46948 /ORGANISM="Rhodomonas abbreviata, Strain Caron Lab Isolate" /LENGTH=479 /DNA_ID=CAMNT_0023411975 /DNA_START=91 /DNA_END=1530 /DNA_ORIENTATION=-
MNLIPPPPPLNYEYRSRPFRGKPPIFDGHNFEFYREELSLWMKKNFSIDWTLTTDDAVRNNRKPTEPQTEYCDQEHAWDAIFTGCKHIQDLKPILQLTVRGTKHMQFASFVWKDIEVFYNPETPSALRNKKLRWKEAAADFSGDISHYKARVRAALSNLGQHAPSNDKIIMRMLTGIMSSPVARDWSEFVKESCSELQSNNSDVHDFFKRAELYSKIHEDFQHTTESVKLNPSQPRPTAPIYPGIEDPSYTEASSAAASNNTEVQSNTTTNKSKRDRDFKEHSKEDKTTSPPAKRRRQRRRPPKHVRLQNRASAERAEDHEDRRSDEHCLDKEEVREMALQVAHTLRTRQTMQQIVNNNIRALQQRDSQQLPINIRAQQDFPPLPLNIQPLPLNTCEQQQQNLQQMLLNIQAQQQQQELHPLPLNILEQQQHDFRQLQLNIREQQQQDFQQLQLNIRAQQQQQEALLLRLQQQLRGFRK